MLSINKVTALILVCAIFGFYVYLKSEMTIIEIKDDLVVKNQESIEPDPVIVIGDLGSGLMPEVPGEDSPTESAGVKFNPLLVDSLLVGKELVFQVASGQKFEGTVENIELTNSKTVIFSGEIAPEGFFILARGPDSIFGTLMTSSGSFEYRGDKSTGSFIRSPQGKLRHDVNIPKSLANTGAKN